MNFQPLTIDVDRSRISRLSNLTSSFTDATKKAATTVTSQRPPPRTTTLSPHIQPSPPITPRSAIPQSTATAPQPYMPPSSFPHSIPGRTSTANTSPHYAHSSVSPRNAIGPLNSNSPRSVTATAPIGTSPRNALVGVQSSSLSRTSPQPALRATSQAMFTRAPAQIAFPRAKVLPNSAPQAHNLLTQHSPPHDTMDSSSIPPSFFMQGGIPQGISLPNQSIHGFLSSPQFLRASPPQFLRSSPSPPTARAHYLLTRRIFSYFQMRICL